MKGAGPGPLTIENDGRKIEAPHAGARSRIQSDRG
jgi:hypothetical protein